MKLKDKLWLGIPLGTALALTMFASYQGWSHDRKLAARRAQIAAEQKARENDPVLKAKHEAELTAKEDAKHFDTEEIEGFKTVVAALDPEKRFISNVQIEDKSSNVIIIGTLALYGQSDLKLDELATSIRKAANQACECSSLVFFKTQNGKTVMTAGVLGVDIKAKDR